MSEITHAEAAHHWMRKHPEAMALFEEYALTMARLGHRFGIGFIAERVRWECRLQSDPGEDFKINNNYRAYIARELISRHPHLANHMTMRRAGAEPPVEPSHGHPLFRHRARCVSRQ